MVDWMQIRQPLLMWYMDHHRDLEWRKTKEPYRIWVSEIMLQQTRVEAVKGYYERFLSELPDIEALSAVSEDRLLKLWEGLGYYNRARNMKRAALKIMEEYGGVFPNAYEEVLKLPGIGAYTAGAICSICYEAPCPAIDGNVLRVMMRLSGCEDNIDDQHTKNKVREWLVPVYEAGNCSGMTQALMELGATVCIPAGIPMCVDCPLKGLCQARQNGTWSRLPVRRKKKERRIEEKTVFVLHCDDQYGIRKRKNVGLLAGMWEFFHIDEVLSPEMAVGFISQQGYGPVELEKQISYTHIFSHVEWRMTAYYIACTDRKKELKWVERGELAGKYALPTAFRIFLERES